MPLPSILQSPLITLKGVGPKVNETLQIMGIHTVGGLLCTRPLRARFSPYVEEFGASYENQSVVMRLEVIKVTPLSKGKSFRTVLLPKRERYVDVVFFTKAFSENSLLRFGQQFYAKGVLRNVMTHPSLIHPEVFPPHVRPEGVETFYTLTKGMTHKKMRTLIGEALTYLPETCEWHSKAFLAQKGWPSFKRTLALLHTPRTVADIRLQPKLLERLAFDAKLAQKIGFMLQKLQHRGRQAYPALGDRTLRKHLLSRAPFKLTADQNQALKEISHDLNQRFPMKRLLQGDVGSGKSMVAYMAMAQCMEAGLQTAYLAPTEVLARQHFEKLCTGFEGTSLKIRLLVSQTPAKKQLVEDIKAHKIHCVVGTHALLQPTVRFHKLGLFVVDEQHRFGVEQRLTLLEQDENRRDTSFFPHFLSMSATPIPRSYALLKWGETDISCLKSRPFHTTLPETYIASQVQMEKVKKIVSQVLAGNGKVFWLCPLIEASQKLSRKTALENRFEDLKRIFGESVAFLHRKLSSDEKAATLKKFSDGDVKLLVSTTVIETGVDIPQASLMVIEDAPSFGLSQLHQLRGRVGRGKTIGWCIALYKSPLSEAARRRLSEFRGARTGFEITERDWEMRGSGRLMGTQQSGFQEASVNEALLREVTTYANTVVLSQLKTHKNLGPFHTLLASFLKDQSLNFLNAA